MLKKSLKNWGRLNSKHLTDGWRVFAKDIKQFLMKEEDENDIVIEEEKCRVKTYQDSVKSLKELQESAVQRNDSDVFSVISQAKVFFESKAAKRVNCVQ
jgi:hypothetical protein